MRIAQLTAPGAQDSSVPSLEGIKSSSLGNMPEQPHMIYEAIYMFNRVFLGQD